MGNRRVPPSAHEQFQDLYYTKIINIAITPLLVEYIFIIILVEYINIYQVYFYDPCIGLHRLHPYSL